MADRSGYIGRNPGDAAVTVAREVFTPSGVTTNFTFAAGYTVGYMDVFLNGVKLVEARDYEAGNGTSVGLSSFAQSGDILELVAYKAFNMGQSIDQITGDLTLNGKLTVTGISTLGDVVSSGIVTADSFSGDSFSGNLTGATVSSSGPLTITDTTASSSTSTGALIVNGGVGIAKSLFVGEGISVGGTITYDDVTNIDSVGFVTAGKGFRATTGGIVVTAGVSTFAAALDVNSSVDVSGGVNLSAGNLKVTAGIVTIGAGLTLSSDFIHLGDNKKIQLGIASDLTIFHDGTWNRIQSSQSKALVIEADSAIAYLRAKINEESVRCNPDAGVELFYDNVKKFETVSAGASVYGALKLQNGLLRENIKITAGKLSANLTINVDNGMLHYFTTQESAQSIPNIISGAGINTDMAIGDTMTVSVLATAHANSFPTNWRIDGVEASAGVTTYWNGGSAPTAGSSSGVDFYTLNFVKTASARYTAFANVSNFA